MNTAIIGYVLLIIGAYLLLTVGYWNENKKRLAASVILLNTGIILICGHFIATSMIGAFFVLPIFISLGALILELIQIKYM